MKKDIFRTIIIVNVIILFLYLLIRLSNQSQMTYIFPIDAYANDYSSHIADLHFLVTYGYHNAVPNWYNGNYVLFAFYPPLWYYFTLPLYYLINNYLIATFLSVLAIYIIGFILIYFFCKLNGISKLESILFFLFFFVNPITIGVFLRLGKTPEMFGWIFFIALSIIIFYYKDRKLDLKFLFLFTFIYTLLMYAHTLVFLISPFLVIPLFIIRNNLRDRIYIIAGGLFTLIFTLPVWSPLIKTASATSTSPSFFPLKWLLSSAPGALTDKVTAFVVPVVFLVLFYLYFVTNNKSKKILLFFGIPIMVSILYFTRILAFVPYLNRATPDMYNVFLIFLSCYMLFKIRVGELPIFTRNVFLFSLFMLPLVGIIISSLFTPWFMPHTKEVNDTFSLLKYVDKNFLVLNPPKEVVPNGVYSYGAIYYNTSSASGWSPLNLTQQDRDRIVRPNICLTNLDCNCLKDSLRNAKVRQIITYTTNCNILEACRFKKLKQEDMACLYEYIY